MKLYASDFERKQSLKKKPAFPIVTDTNEAGNQRRRAVSAVTQQALPKRCLGCARTFGNGPGTPNGRTKRAPENPQICTSCMDREHEYNAQVRKMGEMAHLLIPPLHLQEEAIVIQYDTDDTNDMHILQALKLEAMAQLLTNATETDIRRLLEKVSPLPWDVGTAEDDKNMVVVCDANRQIVAKCGPVSDAMSAFDAMLIVALVNREAKPSSGEREKGR